MKATRKDNIIGGLCAAAVISGGALIVLFLNYIWG